MDRETAKQTIRHSWRTLITDLTTEAKDKANRETSYVCPLCGHGAHGDGLTFNPKSRDRCGLKCFSCDFSGDIIDLYQKISGAGFNETFSLLANRLNLSIDPYKPMESTTSGPSRDKHAQADTDTRMDAKTAPRAAERATEPQADYTSYYMACRERLNDPAAVAYLTERGISLATAEAYWIGYDPKGDPANAPGGVGTLRHPTPRIIVPVNGGHYVGRAIDPNIQKQYAKMNPKGCNPGIFNIRAIYSQDVHEVFVTEGVFDALSILEAGSPAIAINSTANAEMLIKQLQEKSTEATLILSLDNNGAGRKARDTIKKGLQQLNVNYIVVDVCGQYSDPNDRFKADREGFIAAVQAARDQNAPKPDSTSNYIDTLMGDEIRDFHSDIKTGFPNLDKKCDGLYSGLYVLAAISSLGKTTFIHQMGDQIAEAGNDVLYFSLEQSRLEMVSKSLARITAQNDLKTAVTSLSIRKGYKQQQVLEAAEQYKQRVGDRMSIIEGNFACNISFIGDYIRRYINRTGTRPVVMIDYLQILQPEVDSKGRQQTTRETVDSTCTALKRLSREMGLTVICVCSVNRANYLTPVDFESLKESGNIEFTADVVWGLQLHCLESEQAFQNDSKETAKKRGIVKKAKAENPRKIDLVCLKNRYGIANYNCSFEYYPANDLFKPGEEFEEVPKYAGRRT